MSEFFLTRMGSTFYEGSVPRIAKALERIAAALEEQNTLTKESRRVHNVPEDVCKEEGCSHPSHRSQS